MRVLGGLPWAIGGVGVVLTVSCGFIPPRNRSPVAAFKVTNKQRVAAGQWDVTFESTSSDDSAIANFKWDYGDGSAPETVLGDPGKSRRHTYQTASGSFVATLQVFDDDNVSSNIFSDRVVLNPDRPPAPALVATPASGAAPLIVTCDASGTSDPDAEDADFLQYIWNFGDGSPEQTTKNKTIQHVFSSKGQHILSLSVHEDKPDGLTSSAVFAIVQVN
jgi:PKD repeat protein